MARQGSFGKIDIELVSSVQEDRGKPEADAPFRIAILGDFSGRANRGIFEWGAALAERRPRAVDRDNLDEVMAKLGVSTLLPLGDEDTPPVAIQLTQLDDLHPDSLFQCLEVFKAVSENRKKLSDPSFFAQAANGLQKRTRPPVLPASSGELEESLKPLLKQTTASLLDEVIDETRGERLKREPPHSLSEWESFLNRIVQPHLVPDIEKRQSEILAIVDATTGDLMRAILHHPDYQAMEAAWRGLHFAVSRIETGEELMLYLFDISKAELAADLGSTEDLRETSTYKLLVEQALVTSGEEPWAVLAGIYSFGETCEDAELLGRMAKIAKAAGAPFISSASDRLLGCESLAQTPDPRNWSRVANADGKSAWDALRKLPEASYLGLALPRILLRLPYGGETDPVERFDFEEMEGRPDHDHYLWGNPSFACLYLLAQAFSENGWDLQPGTVQDVEALPLHVYEEEGESRTKPCAELVLTQDAVEAIIKKGFMPLISFKNQDRAQLAYFQAITDPPRLLSGRWA